jgi:hypothetical protein
MDQDPTELPRAGPRLEQLLAKVQRPSVFDLDMAKVGEALLAVAFISRHLGHEHPADTVRDYIAPHVDAPGFEPATPEQRFVYGMLTGRTDDLTTMEEMLVWVKMPKQPL